MADLSYRQTKIQDKRKQTDFREFLMEIASRYPLNIYRVNGTITRYPDTKRRWLVWWPWLDQQSANPSNYQWVFLEDLWRLYQSWNKTPLMSWGQNENSSYTDVCYWTKDSYLSFSLGLWVERWIYSRFAAENCSDIYNSICILSNSTQIYSSVNIKNSYSIFYSLNIQSSNNLWFCINMDWCSECINCEWLTNQKYFINNIQYNKDVFFVKKQELLSHKDTYIEYVDWISWKKMENIGSSEIDNCMWVNRSYNIQNWYLAYDVLDSRNVVLFGGWESGSSNFYDGIDIGFNSHHFYGTCQAWWDSSHLYLYLFGWWNSHNCYYSMNLSSCSFCLWCIGLENKSYCILNKQYSKEERYEKVDEIFWQMVSDGSLWEFFSASMNPFYFNDTAAYLIDPSFTKEEVTARWYLWRDEPIKVDIPEWAQTVSVDELWEFESMVDGVWTIDESICKKVILDHEWNAYRIIPMELEFLRKHWLPLPRKHWLERMKENFKIN